MIKYLQEQKNQLQGARWPMCNILSFSKGNGGNGVKILSVLKIQKSHREGENSSFEKNEIM